MYVRCIESSVFLIENDVDWKDSIKYTHLITVFFDWNILLTCTVYQLNSWVWVCVLCALCDNIVMYINEVDDENDKKEEKHLWNTVSRTDIILNLSAFVSTLKCLLYTNKTNKQTKIRFAQCVVYFYGLCFFRAWSLVLSHLKFSLDLNSISVIFFGFVATENLFRSRV